jgi:bifunctional non-homologous end joining protein LigD
VGPFCAPITTERYPELAALRLLPAGTMLDGELVLIRDGRADFHALMSRHSRRPRRAPFFAEPVHYIVFDLLYYRGRCLTDRPFEERLHILHTRLPELPCVSLCEGAIGDGKAFFEAAIHAGHEGVVAKKLATRYLPNQRGTAWRKIKQTFDLPCVVIGYRVGADGLRDLLMAALVDGQLAFVGVVELGVRAALLLRLQALSVARPAVSCRMTAQWVKPELFGTVRFAGWRPGGIWRDAALLRWDF